MKWEFTSWGEWDFPFLLWLILLNTTYSWICRIFELISLHRNILILKLYSPILQFHWYLECAPVIPTKCGKVVSLPTDLLKIIERRGAYFFWGINRTHLTINATFYVVGSNVRIDTTLLGFDNMNWQRGSRSYIFKGQGEHY